MTHFNHYFVAYNNFDDAIIFRDVIKYNHLFETHGSYPTFKRHQEAYFKAKFDRRFTQHSKRHKRILMQDSYYKIWRDIYHVVSGDYKANMIVLDENGLAKNYQPLMLHPEGKDWTRQVVADAKDLLHFEQNRISLMSYGGYDEPFDDYLKRLAVF